MESNKEPNEESLTTGGMSNTLTTDTTDSNLDAGITALPGHKYSEEELERILEIEKEALEQFPPNQGHYFQSKVLLIDQFKAFANLHGFEVAQDGKTIACNRRELTTADTNKQKKRKKELPEYKRRKRETNRCGCTFSLRYTFCKNIPGAPEGSVRITYGSFKHSNGCSPSSSQLVAQKTQSGAYSKKILAQKKFEEIVSYARRANKNFIDARTLRTMLREFLPPRVPIPAQFLANFRIRLKRILENNDAEEAAAAAQSLIDPTSAATAADESNPDWLDQASIHARELLKEALQYGTDSERILSLLRKLSNEDAGFTFAVARDRYGELIGFLWQTPAMRANFELYGDTLFLDMMKRQLNSVHFPYYGISLIDSNGNLCLGGESLLITERLEAYVWSVNQLLAMTPTKARSSIKMIYGDGIMSVRLLQLLKIENTCNLGLDVHHLLGVGGDWEKFFGGLWNSLQPLFSDLVYSQSKECYNRSIQAIRDRLQDQTHYLDYVEREVHPNRKLFVRYFVLQYPMNLMKQGQSIAESNHSSYVQRIGPSSTVEPAVAVVEMLERQKEMNSEKEGKLFQKYMLAKTKSSLLFSAGKVDDAQAVQSLSEWGYEIWSKAISQSKRMKATVVDGVVHATVVQSGVVLSTFPVGGYCESCINKIAFGCPCACEFSYYGISFNIENWPKRFHQQEKVPVSHSIGNYKSGDAMYDPTELDSTQSDYSDDDGAVLMDYECDGDYQDPGNEAVVEQPTFPPATNTLVDQGTENHPPLNDCGTQSRNGKMSFEQIMRVLTDFAQTVQGHRDLPTMLGVVVAMKEHATLGEAVSEPMEDKIQGYLSQFLTFRSGETLFSTRSDVGAATSRPLVQAQVSQSGRIRTSRLKSGAETRHHSIPRGNSSTPLCSFCKQPGHKVSNCRTMGGYGDYIPRTERDGYALELGDDRYHALEQVPPVIEEYISTADFGKRLAWPRKAVHLVVETVYRNPNYIAAASRFASSSNKAPPEENIVKVAFLGEGGSRLVAEQDADFVDYYTVATVRKWIYQHFKPETKRLLSKLKRGPQNKDPFLYHH